MEILTLPSSPRSQMLHNQQILMKKELSPIAIWPIVIDESWQHDEYKRLPRKRNFTTFEITKFVVNEIKQNFKRS